MSTVSAPHQAPLRSVDRPAGLRAALAIAAALAGLPAAAGEAVKFEATYSIAIRGVTIGNVTSEIRLGEDGYSARLVGSVGSFLRFFSDLTADVAGSGAISGDRLLPATYAFATSEGKRQMRVSMALRDGSVATLDTEPPTKVRKSRVPVTPEHLRNVVDPLAAFLVAVAPGAAIDGSRACDRKVPVFDGWQRYDIDLSYKATKHIKGRGDAYDGDVFVCAARYVPIAGHRENAKSVRDLVDNKRLEVWLAPVTGQPILVPYKILIGDTRLGDLAIVAGRFTVTPPGNRASAE